MVWRSYKVFLKTLRNLIFLSTMIVWERLKQSLIFISAKANVFAFYSPVGLATENDVIAHVMTR